MTPLRPPRRWIEPWPDGQPAPEAPAAAAWVAALARRLAAGDLDAAAIARAARLDVRTVSAVLDGTRWPTFRTASVLAEVDVHRTEPERPEKSPTRSQR